MIILKRIKNIFYITSLVVLVMPVLAHATIDDPFNNSFRKARKKEINEKVRTFCSAGAYNEERCEKYCIDLRDWFYWNEKWYDFWSPWELKGGWFHDSGAVFLCDHPNKKIGSSGQATRVKKPKISQKKIIKNDDGTTTEIIKKKIEGDMAEVSTIFDKEHKKLHEIVSTETKNGEDIVTRKKVKTNFNESTKFKEEITEEVFETEILTKSTTMQKGEESVIKTEKSFDSNIVTELIIQEGQSEDNLQKVEHKLFNQALIATEELQNKHIQIVYNTEQPKDIQDVFFDKLNQELVINKNREKKILLKEGINILHSGDKEVGFNQNISINVKSGEIFVKVGDDDLIKWAMMPDQLSEKILKEGDLDRINNMQIISDNNSVKYIVQGVKRKKIFKLYPVEIQQNKIYNLDNGDLIKTQMDRKNSFLDRISFTIIERIFY